MKFPANTASEFMANAGRKYGGNALGVTTPHYEAKNGGFKAGKLLKIEFTLSISAEWAEPGTGSPDTVNKAAIAEISAMTKKHEETHKATYQKAFDDWDPKKQAQDLMDDTYASKGEADKAVKAAVEDLKAVLKKACLALHAKEGVIEMDQVITITSKPAGASGCT